MGYAGSWAENFFVRPSLGVEGAPGRERAVEAMRSAWIVHGNELSFVSDFSQSIVEIERSVCLESQCRWLTGLEAPFGGAGEALSA